MILAVDGGATKTVALVFKDEVLGVGVSSSGNFVEVGEEKAKENLLEAVNEALRNASASIDEVKKATFSLAGVGDSRKFTEVGERIAKSIFRNAKVQNDGYGAMRATAMFKEGAVFAPGTGSVAFLQKGGKVTRIGGWGWFFGDEGSASWIAKRAITYATRSVDGVEVESVLPREVEKFFGDEFREVVTRLTKEQNKREIASFAVRVDQLSATDVLAFKVMKEVSEYIDTMVERLKRDVDNVYLLGGVMRSNAVRRLLRNKVRYFMGYHAVVGGVVELLKVNDEETRDDLVRQVNRALAKLPPERLRKYLFIESVNELYHGL
ncbi:MAG: hypothetical protein MPF33_10710 [Candidatus Aramenus sp.]|nr:hypothetical protein [Candidatus Aramenus sp.]